MYIPNLVPCHNRLRSPEKLKFFTEDYEKTIKLSNVGGTLYIHDGHHRLVFEFLRGKHNLDDDFFSIKDMSKEEYDEINFGRMYVTPFDIVRECRKPEFFEYKNIIERMTTSSKKCAERHNVQHYTAKKIGEDIICDFIRSTKHMYCEPRVVFNLGDLALNYLR